MHHRYKGLILPYYLFSISAAAMPLYSPCASVDVHRFLAVLIYPTPNTIPEIRYIGNDDREECEIANIVALMRRLPGMDRDGNKHESTTPLYTNSSKMGVMTITSKPSKAFVKLSPSFRMIAPGVASTTGITLSKITLKHTAVTAITVPWMLDSHETSQ